MYPVPTTCQVCNNAYHITELHCRRCGSTLSGHFSLGRLNRLSEDQLRFVETFIVCEGKINRVEQELGMSYPAVRSRLQEVIQALGGQVNEPPPTAPPPPPAAPAPPVNDDRRQAILAKVSAGELTAKQAAELLRQS